VRRSPEVSSQELRIRRDWPDYITNARHRNLFIAHQDGVQLESCESFQFRELFRLSHAIRRPLISKLGIGRVKSGRGRCLSALGFRGVDLRIARGC
jgi:hypothetical protein